MIHSDYPYASPPGTHLWQPTLLPPQTAAEPPIASLANESADAPPALSKLAVIVAVIVAIASVGNAVMMPLATMIEPGPGFKYGLAYIFFMVGSIGGQAAILTVLAVWGGGPLWLRLLWHWGLVLLAFSAWTFGFMIAMVIRFWQIPTEEFRVVLFALPLLALACQAVPWLFKLYLDWRIEHDEDPEQPANSQRLSIRDMLLAIIIVAVSMAAVRFAKPANAEGAAYWAVWGIGCAVAAGLSLVVLVPMVAAVLGVRRGWLGGLEVTALAAVLAAVGSVVWILLNAGGPSDAEIVVVVSSAVFGFTLTIAGALGIARAYGYRLVRQRKGL